MADGVEPLAVIPPRLLVSLGEFFSPFSTGVRVRTPRRAVPV